MEIKDYGHIQVRHVHAILIKPATGLFSHVRLYWGGGSIKDQPPSLDLIADLNQDLSGNMQAHILQPN